MVRWMVVMMMGVMRMVWRHHRLGVGLRRVWRQPRQGRHRHAKVWPAHLAARHPGGWMFNINDDEYYIRILFFVYCFFVFLIYAHEDTTTTN